MSVEFKVTIDAPRSGRVARIAVQAPPNLDQDGYRISISEDEIKLLNKDDECCSCLKFPDFKLEADPSRVINISAGQTILEQIHGKGSNRYTIMDLSKKPSEAKHDPSESLMHCKKVIDSKGDLDVKVVCRSCNNCIAFVNTKRVLPLPSINWRDGSREWFCGCAGKPKPPPSDLSPGESDVFYNQSFVCFNVSNLSKGDIDAFPLEVRKVQVLSCKKCNLELGSSDNKTVTVWSNLISFQGEDSTQDLSEPNYGTTFRRIMDELIKEVQFLRAKIVIENCLNPKEGMKFHSFQLFSCQMDKTWRGYLDPFQPASQMHLLKNRVPLLYDKTNGSTDDYTTFRVTPKVLETAIDIMETSTNECLPTDCQLDPQDQMKLGYLQLLG